jgi:Transposase zinc-binding domain
MKGGRSGGSVVKPLHRKQIITRARYHPMMTQPSGDWSVFKQIFADHWDAFQRAHPRYQTSYYDGLVAKMLACGNPDKMGYVEYRCLQCGQGTHRVTMSCKSSLCLRCAKVYVDNWVSQVSQLSTRG